MAQGETTSTFDLIVVGGTDAVGREIGDVYARQLGRYAIYSTIERVQVLYADDPMVQRSQRRRLAALACLRSEIDGSLAPWRRANARWRLNTAAQQYDGRVAAALVEALEGNLDSGQRILQMVRNEISCERTSRAQLYYLLSTIGIALVFLLPCAVALAGFGSWRGIVYVPSRMIWLSVTAGVIGTVYSIALSLRKRDVTNDRRWLDHLTDAGVRICIGAIAGFVVAEFLLTGALQLRIGNVALPGATDRILSTTSSLAFVLLAGFLAGFAERFVPDLLNSYASDQVAKPVSTAPPPLPPPSPPGTGATQIGAAGAGGAVPPSSNGAKDLSVVAAELPPGPTASPDALQAPDAVVSPPVLDEPEPGPCPFEPAEPEGGQGEEPPAQP